MGLSLILLLSYGVSDNLAKAPAGYGISDNLVKATAVCLHSLVSLRLIFGGKILSMLPAAAPGCQWKTV